jgi:hypothetical protein
MVSGKLIGRDVEGCGRVSVRNVAPVFTGGTVENHETVQSE